MARWPTMITRDGKWSVEVMTIRGRQSFRVKMLQKVTPPGSGWTPAGQTMTTIAEVRELLGDAFDDLVEVRDRQRMEGGR